MKTSFRIITTYFLFVFIIFTIRKSQALPNKINVWPELISSFEIYEDSLDLPFDSIIKLDDKLFFAYKGEQFKNNNRYWLRLTVDNSIAIHKNYFIHFNKLLSHVKLYQKEENTNYVEKTESTLIPDQERLVGGLFEDKVPFLITGNEKTILYLKIRTKQKSAFNLSSIKIIAVSDYKGLTHKLDFIEFFFLGVILVLILLNLTLFLLTRHKLYFYYFVYIFSTALFFISWYEVLERFVFLNFYWVDFSLLHFSVTVSQAVYYWFLIELLKDENIPVWKKIIQKSAKVAFVVGFVIITIGFFNFNLYASLNDIYSLLNGIFVITMFLLLFKKVSVKVKIILCGAVIVVLGGMTSVIADFFKFSYFHILYYQFGVFVELILFTIAINYFYSKERLEKIKLNFANYKLETEKNKSRIENRELVEKLDLNNRELAAKSIIINQKESIINGITEYLSEVGELNSSEYPAFQKKIKSLQLNSKIENWKEFEYHFKKIHPKFYLKLMEMYPNLTRNEIKLCAFIKLNLSTKEICSITGKSQNTIDVSRSRLRKKIGLKDENLTSFLMRIG